MCKYYILTMSVKNADKKRRKNSEEIVCEKCDFRTFKRSEFDRHLATQKHKYLHVLTDTYTKNAKKRLTFSCECGKNYTHRQSLYTHRKVCDEFIDVIKSYEVSKQKCEDDISLEMSKQMLLSKQTSSDEKIDKLIGLVETMAEQNANLQTQLVKQNETANRMVNNSGTIHTNSHNTNRTFNLNLFLNETCKDAMNITDFVKSLQLNTQDLERVGECGYVEGISHALLKGLNELEVHKRPIHCSDLKREIIHIKDKDKWEQDNESQDKLKKVIKDVSTKNIMLLDDWQRLNPGYDRYDDKKNDIYLKMMVQAMGPADDVAERRDFGKIIRRIAKNTIIDKKTR